MHVMFLYASTGSGHFKAAEYVEEALIELNKEIKISMADVLNLCDFPIESFVLKAFRVLISERPNLYRFLYRLSENNALFNCIAGFFFKKSIIKLKNRCILYEITTLVCTHPLALLFASKLKNEMKKQCPVTMGIITDYQIHRFWLYPGIDLYCVPNNEMKKELLQMGWNKKNVKVTGVPCPVNLLSSNLQNKSQKPFYLVSGGGWGLGNLEETTRNLLKKVLDCNLLVVTGKNHSLYKKLKALEKKNQGRLMVKGTIPHLFSVMKSALVVLTKPGGLTVTEAMILRKPLILLNPLPGAEEKNLDYLINHGAAISYKSFINDPDIIYRWEKLYSEKQELTANNNSSRIIASWIDNTSKLLTKGL